MEQSADLDLVPVPIAGAATARIVPGHHVAARFSGDSDLFFPELVHQTLAALVNVPDGVASVIVPVTPGETVTLPFPPSAHFEAAAGDGNLAIKVGDVVVILQGYVAAAEHNPPVIEASDGQKLDIATILAATDPNSDIETAAGPGGERGHGADNTGAILQPFGEAGGLGGFESIGAQDDANSPSGFSGDGDAGGSDRPNGAESFAAASGAAGEHGPNRPPAVEDLTLTTDEDSKLQGRLAATDPDGDPITYHLVGAVPDGFTLAADGSWSYDPRGQYDYLNGETDLAPAQQSTVTFQYVANDGQVDSNVATVTIAIDGKNDPATLSGTTSGDFYLNTNTAAIGGGLSIWDPDMGEAHTVAASGHSAFGTWTVFDDGNWRYSADDDNPDVAALAASRGDDTLTDQFVVTSLDGSASETITVTIHSQGDVAPKISAEGGIRGLTEESATTISLADFTTITDPDSTAFTYRVSGTLPAGVTLAPDGTLQIALAGHYDHLPEGQTEVVEVQYYVSDGIYGSNVGTFSLYIDGVNDTASFSGDATGGYLFGSNLAATEGTLIVTDLDDGESHTKASIGTATYGSWSVDADGHWVYTPDLGNDAVANLAHGATLTDHFTVFSADFSTSQTVTVTIEGQDVKPQIASTLAGVALTEDQSKTIQLADTTTIADPDSSAFVYTAQTLPPGVTLDADGTLHVDAAGNYDYLKAGQTETVQVNYMVIEADHPTQASNIVTVPIVITGVNNPAVLSGDATGDYFLKSNIAAIGGALTITDPDQGEAQTVDASGHSAYGTWVVFDDGNWRYSVDENNPDIAQLAAAGGAGTLTDQFVVTSLDGTASQTITITIHAQPDVQPQITTTLDAIALGEESTKTVVLSDYTTITDPDSASFTYVLYSGATPGVSLTPDGKLTIDAADAYDSIPGGQTQTLDLSYGVSDGTYGSNSEHIIVTITGANDLAGISGVTSGSYVVGSGAPITNSVLVSDPDTGEEHTATAHGTATYGTWSVDADGNWYYSADLDNAAVKTLGASDTLTDHFSVSSLDHTANQEITVTIHGAGYVEPAGLLAAVAAPAMAADDLIFGGGDDDTLIYHDGAQVQGGSDSVAAQGGLAGDPAARGDVLVIDHALDLTQLDLSGSGGIETLSLLNAESHAAGAQSLTINATNVATLSDHTINPDGLFGEHGAIRIDTDAVDQLYLSISKDGGSWTDTGIEVAGYAVFAHEAVADHPDSTDAYVMVAATHKTNVHLNQDAA